MHRKMQQKEWRTTKSQMGPSLSVPTPAPAPVVVNRPEVLLELSRQCHESPPREESGHACALHEFLADKEYDKNGALSYSFVVRGHAFDPYEPSGADDLWNNASRCGAMMRSWNLNHTVHRVYRSTIRPGHGSAREIETHTLVFPW
jgi:hypothetical protein